MTSLIQPSFAAGELSPFLHGRVDLAKFRVGVRTLQNFFVHPQGGASNRPGTRFIGEVGDSSRRHRLIPFEFRTLPAGQTYVLVFGHLAMQVAMWNGTSWGFVEASPDVRFTLATPYDSDDLPLLKHVQSADTMTLTHPAYSARRLSRTGHAAWTLAPITFAPSTQPPTGLTATAPGSAGHVVVTAISDATGEESLPSAEAGATSDSAGTWSWTEAGGSTNYNVYKKKGSAFGFVAQVQQATWTDSNLDPDIANTPPGNRNPFGVQLLTGASVISGGSGYNAPTGEVIDGGRTITTVTLGVSGGAIATATLADTNKEASPNAYVKITDGAGTGAVLTPTFSEDELGNATISGATIVAGGSGYAGSVQINMVLFGTIDYYPYTFSVTVDGGGAITGVTPVLTYPFPAEHKTYIALIVTDSVGAGAQIALNVSSEIDSGTRNPACSTYFLQRQVYGGTTAQPQGLWFTAVGAFGNMNVSTPTRDSDAITRALTGRQVNEIRHLVPIGSSMLVMTSGAEWRCWPGPSSNALTPAACFTLPQTTHGASHVPPIQAGGDVLFVQEKGSRVRALRFDALQDQYQSFDMSVLAGHLLYDTAGAHRIVDWAFAAEPHQIVWACRDDGVLLGFTTMREHDVHAWHRHVTDGLVESVATVTEPDGWGGYEDAVYLIVNRTIGPEGDGETRRYLERMVSRTFPTIADAWFVDCGLQYDGVPAGIIGGLEHLEGKTVAVLADGNVVPDRTVANGQIALDAEYAKVTVGLPYTADLETLNLELATQAGPTVQGRMKKIAQVTVRVKDSRGLAVGISQTVLQEVKQRQVEALGAAMQPFSGDHAVTIPSEWNRDGRLFVRQRYPLPATILDLIPEVAVGN
jgi:hypothetical protein